LYADLNSAKQHITRIKIRHLKFYGYIQCDITGYEEYTPMELVGEFCEDIPTFFNSHDHLEGLYTDNYGEADRKMRELRDDLLSPPRAHVSAKLACIIHHYFHNLPY